MDAPITTKEAARRIGVTPSAIRHAMRRGDLKHTKHGRDLFTTARWLAEYRTEHPPKPRS